MGNILNDKNNVGLEKKTANTEITPNIDKLNYTPSETEDSRMSIASSANMFSPSIFGLLHVSSFTHLRGLNEGV